MELLIVIALLGVLATLVLIAVDPSAMMNRARTSKGISMGSQIDKNLSFEEVGNWDFDNSNPGVVTDTSGYKNNATITGATYDCTDTPFHTIGQGANKCSMVYAGGQSLSVVNSYSLDITSSITISLWAKTTQFQASWINIIQKGGNCSLGQRSYMVTSHSGVWGMSFGDCLSLPNGTDINQAKYRVDDGKWHHLAFTASGTIWRAYLDGSQIAQINKTNLPASTTNNLILGDSGFIGKLDDVRIYKTALTSGEVQKLYAQDFLKHQMPLSY